MCCYIEFCLTSINESFSSYNFFFLDIVVSFHSDAATIMLSGQIADGFTTIFAGELVKDVLIKDVLYKRGFSRPYLRCLGTEEADYVMREVHEGICENYSGSRSLVHKLVRAGYY